MVSIGNVHLQKHYRDKAEAKKVLAKMVDPGPKADSRVGQLRGITQPPTAWLKWSKMVTGVDHFSQSIRTGYELTRRRGRGATW